MLAAAAAFHTSPVSQVGLDLLMTALQDPMALFSQRSPGKRSGPLVSIKGKTGPRERVLSSVRDRPTPQIADIPAVVLDLPVVVDIPPGTFFSPPPSPMTPGEIVDSPFAPATPYVPATPFSISVPGFIPGETPPPLVAVAPPEVPPPASPLLPPIVGSNPTDTPPFLTPPGGTPESPPGTTPESPPETPSGTTPGGPIILPEPASWSVMIMGLIATGFVRRRNRRSR